MFKKVVGFVVLSFFICLFVPLNGYASKKFVWQLATTWPNGTMMHAQALDFAKRVNTISGGRLTIEVHPAGAIVDAPGVQDATSAGTIDAYHTFSSYWIGKMPGAPFFGSVPMTMEPFVYISWVYEGGGLELWQKMYDQAGENVKVLPLGLLHPEILAWSNKPITTLDDWKGLKYRTSGWWAEILRGQGASVAVMAAGELYPALERGVLDALEFTTPYGDKTLGFFEIAKYIATPGIHQPGTIYYLGINKKSWDALPEDLKALVETASRASTIWTWTWDFNNSLDALEEYESRGITITYLNEEAQLKIQQDTWKMLEDRAKKMGGIFAETYESMMKYRERALRYEKYMMPVRGALSSK